MQLRMVAPPVAVGLGHRGGRHRPGHRPLGPVRLGRGHGPPPRPAPAAPGRADRQLPHAGRGGRGGRPGAGRGRSRARARPPRPPDRGTTPLSSTSRPDDLAGAVVPARRPQACRDVAPGTAAVLAPASLVGDLALALDAAGRSTPSTPAATASGRRSASSPSIWPTASSSTPSWWWSRPPSPRNRRRDSGPSTSRSPAPPDGSPSSTRPLPPALDR